MSSDLATVDAVASAYYESRPFRRGEQPDWERFRSLFLPSASIVQASHRPGYFYVWHDLDDYIAEHQALQQPTDELSQVERERNINQLGNIAHVFSTYDQLFTDNERTWSEPGVNSFHLVRDDKGQWRITSWHWD